MIFDNFSQDSKKATVKTLLAISELCNSIILNDLADGTNLLEEIDPKDMTNGEKLLDSIKQHNDRRDTVHREEADAELDKMADEIFNKSRKTSHNTNSVENTRTFESNEEILDLAGDGEGDEWVCKEPLDKDKNSEHVGSNSTYIPVVEMSESFTEPDRDTESVAVDEVYNVDPEEQKRLSSNYWGRINLGSLQRKDYFDPLEFSEKTKESHPITERPEEETAPEVSPILRFDPLLFKNEPNQMFLGLDESHDSFTWDMENYGTIAVLGDTIGEESKVGKLLADYAFNNKKSVELKILNPEVGNTSYLNYRTGEKAVSASLKYVLKTLKETNELMSSRYQEYDKRGSITLDSLKREHSRIIIWVEEINSYIPLPSDTPETKSAKEQILLHLISILRMGSGAKINMIVKSSQNLSYALVLEGMDLDILLPLKLYSEDALHSNQVEVPHSELIRAWLSEEEAESNKILAYSGDQFKIINLMESHRTSAP